MNENEMQEFEYRLVYLRPSHYSDERIAVGILSSNEAKIDSRFLASGSPIESMIQLLGEDAVEQFQFAVSEFRRALMLCPNLDSLRSPTNIFMLGDKASAYTDDRANLITSILESASCLVRHTSTRSTEIAGTAQPRLIREIFNHVSQLNPGIASEIFNKRVSVAGDTIDLPIYGRRIFGAPVSFANSAQIVRAESYVAKFNWLRSHLVQTPKIYLVAPAGEGQSSARIVPQLKELTAIAAASKVDLSIAETANELAQRVLKDEAA